MTIVNLSLQPFSFSHSIIVINQLSGHPLLCVFPLLLIPCIVVTQWITSIPIYCYWFRLPFGHLLLPAGHENTTIYISNHSRELIQLFLTKMLQNPMIQCRSLSFYCTHHHSFPTSQVIQVPTSLPKRCKLYILITKCKSIPEFNYINTCLLLVIINYLK